MSKHLIVAGLTGNIYLTTFKITPSGQTLGTGVKTDYTDEAIKAVFQHMENKCGNKDQFSYTLKGCGRLVLKKRYNMLFKILQILLIQTKTPEYTIRKQDLRFLGTPIRSNNDYSANLRVGEI